MIIRGVSYEIKTEGQVNQIKTEIGNPEVNMELIQLEKAPKIAVYTPPNLQPWDDAVTLVLTYAEIPYDIVYDKEIIDGELPDNFINKSLGTKFLQLGIVILGLTISASNALELTIVYFPYISIFVFVIFTQHVF